MKIRFLLDENMSPEVIEEVGNRDKAIDIIRVGRPNAPPLGTLDPEILLFCEAERRMLVTGNRKSMPGHLRDHFAAGRQHWGIMELAAKLYPEQLAEQIYLFWETSEAEEWMNQQIRIPW